MNHGSDNNFITIFLQYEGLYSNYTNNNMKSVSEYKFLIILLRKSGFYALLGWFNR